MLHLFTSHHCSSCDHVSVWKVIISFQTLKSIAIFHLSWSLQMIFLSFCSNFIF